MRRCAIVLRAVVRRLTAVVLAVPVSGTATAHAAALDGATLTWPWALPFAGLLFTIAIGPMLFPKIWHAHYGKIAAFWALLALVPIGAFYGPAAALATAAHAMVGEYLSFIVLLFALYTIAGGVLVTGDLRGVPLHNTAVLAFGTGIASIVGTTGAAMILIRPIIRANAGRRYQAHVIVFFIVLVANVGGALSPLGDPPLFIGFLRGVGFFWPVASLWFQTAIVAIMLLGSFYAVDRFLAQREGSGIHATQTATGERLRVRGKINIVLIAVVIAAILLSALWKPGVSVSIFGTPLELQNGLRDAVLMAAALLSLYLTPDEHRASNGFSWEPIREVAKLFAGIFVAIAPVLAMLQAGRDGTFAFLLSAVTAKDGLPHEAAYFWLTGLLSAALDNAPTYLVFFELAGGDPQSLMGPLAGTLAAISMGAVYMGALTYIGNAPNLMVRAIAEDRGIAMPSFFGYMLWASLILLPLLLLLTLLPISPILKFQ